VTRRTVRTTPTMHSLCSVRAIGPWRLCGGALAARSERSCIVSPEAHGNAYAPPTYAGSRSVLNA
jgi:hypothetical protein